MPERNSDEKLRLLPKLEKIEGAGKETVIIATLEFEPNQCKSAFIESTSHQLEDPPLPTESQGISMAIGLGRAQVVGVEDIKNSPKVLLTLNIAYDQIPLIYEGVNRYPTNMGGPLTSILESEIISAN